MLEFSNYYLPEVDNLNDIFIISYSIIDDIYNNVIPVKIRNRRNIHESKLSNSEIISISLVGELLTIDSEKAWFNFVKKNF